MAIDVDDLRNEVGATAAEDDRLTKTLAGAQLILDANLDTAKTDVPEVIYDQAWLSVARDIWNQRQAPNGVMSVTNYDDQGIPAPIRVSTDPMRTARPLLSPWMGPVIA